MTFDESLARLATLTDADLARAAWPFRGKTTDLGYARYHALEEEQRAVITAIRALDAYSGDARAICRRIGALRGLHQRRSDPATLRALDAALAEKTGS